MCHHAAPWRCPAAWSCQPHERQFSHVCVSVCACVCVCACVFMCGLEEQPLLSLSPLTLMLASNAICNGLCTLVSLLMCLLLRHRMALPAAPDLKLQFRYCCCRSGDAFGAVSMAYLFSLTLSHLLPPLRISLVSFLVSLAIPFPPRPSTCWMSSRQSDTSF